MIKKNDDGAGPGRPAHLPTEALRRRVRELSGFGFEQKYICIALGVSAPTLRKHYSEDIDRGAVEANELVARALFAETQNKHSNNRVRAQEFWLSRRAGWVDKQEHAHFGRLEMERIERVIVEPREGES